MLENFEPQSVFKYFEKIASIPHGSSNTKAISDYVVSVCKEHGLSYVQDSYNNVIVYKESAKGYEDKPPVMLQGHLDMVCEKNFETDARFDFETDPLKLSVMDDYIYAKGTTLGGDDGIGVAYMLSLLTDDTLIAPKLECVFTSDEETGMNGAHALDVSLLKSKRLINLDHEDEGIILTSCAGGKKVVLSVPVRRIEKSGIKYNIVICGLLGGHSGTEIDKYRANANLFMGRLLQFLETRVKFDLLSISGGLQDNAIPRECNAEIIVSEDDSQKLEDIFYEFESIIKNEYKSVEKNMMVYCENCDFVTEKVLTYKTMQRVIFLLMTLPDGVQRMSPSTKGLVQTSSNVGIIKLRKDKFEVLISIRSSITSEKEALSTKIKYLIETIGGTFLEEGDYPAWEYSENSALRDAAISCFRKVLCYEPRAEGIHAGLETGIFYNKIKNLDIISFGPNVLDIHTPKEKLSISSAKRVYDVLVELLKVLAEN